jgi:pantetheine-phosphate adenylyltransferase
LVRGIRDTSDYLYEEKIARTNYEINPELKTIYFRAENDAISSTLVRELNNHNMDISKYVPKEVLECKKFILKG